MRHYSFIGEYREIDEGARPGDIIYETMPVSDEEITKLNTKPWSISSYPPSLAYRKTTLPGGLHRNNR